MVLVDTEQDFIAVLAPFLQQRSFVSEFRMQNWWGGNFMVTDKILIEELGIDDINMTPL